MEIKEGRFRDDLFFRLNVIPIHVPPLRERIEDLPILVNVSWGIWPKNYPPLKKPCPKMPLKILKQWHWKGNVRELKNLMERLSIMVDGDVIGKKDLPAPYKS